MNYFKNCRRIVFKMGTSTLTHSTGLINIRRVEHLIKVLSDIKNSGKEIVIVTSGAIGVGVGKLKLSQKPTDMPTKQAAASVGQCELMYLYDKQFAHYGHLVAQMLLTKDIVMDAVRKQNVKNSFERLLQLSAVPVVNENDAVSIEEIEFGDNDTLSAVVARLCGADALVILSDIDGLYDKDPHTDRSARKIPVVHEITDELKANAGGAGSKLGTGGMITKLQAAEMCFEDGIVAAIVNGEDPNILYDLLEGQQVGTIFSAKKDH